MYFAHWFYFESLKLYAGVQCPIPALLFGSVAGCRNDPLSLVHQSGFVLRAFHEGAHDFIAKQMLRFVPFPINPGRSTWSYYGFRMRFAPAKYQ